MSVTSSPHITDSVLAHFRRGDLLLAFSNYGELIASAHRVSPSTMSFMVRHTSGYISIAMNRSRLRELNIPPMAGVLDDGQGKDFVVSVDAAQRITTGISARDRSITANLLTEATTTVDDIVRPGHLVVREIESVRSPNIALGVDLCIAAGVSRAVVSAHLVTEDGELADRDYCTAWAAEHGITALSTRPFAPDMH